MVHGAEHLPSLSSLTSDIAQLSSAMPYLSSVVALILPEKQQRCPVPTPRSLAGRSNSSPARRSYLFQGTLSQLSLITVVSMQMRVIVFCSAISVASSGGASSVASPTPAPTVVWVLLWIILVCSSFLLGYCCQL